MSLVGIVSLLCAALAAVVLVTFLARGAPNNVGAKLWLAMGLGVLPLVANGTATVQSLGQSTERSFCGSCHVMERHHDDLVAPDSVGLAARHARNTQFGERACYVCHANYGLYGYPLTKLEGMKHVYNYYLGGYRQMSLDEAVSEIRLARPYRNENCVQCHSGKLDSWRHVPEHAALSAELEGERVSCLGGGCHGPAHPFNKPRPAGVEGGT